MRTDLPGADRSRLRVHPLCLIAGVLSAFTGQLFLFLAACLAALEHECAHAIVARRYGFTLDRVVLMPYGAVISGDISGITRKQELAVLAAGPLVNLATATMFVALWWLFPETYPFTDAAANVSLSLFIVNLLPAYPLDGGRMLKALLRPLGERRAHAICLALSLLTAAGVMAYFIVSCFSSPAFTALAFSVMVAFGAVGGGSYRRITFSRKRRFMRGVEEMRIAISADCTLQSALRYLREDRYLVFVLFEDETFYGELPEEELLAALGKGDYSRTLRECIAQ